jgi:hypothetical protein
MRRAWASRFLLGDRSGTADPANRPRYEKTASRGALRFPRARLPGHFKRVILDAHAQHCRFAYAKAGSCTPRRKP